MTSFSDKFNRADASIEADLKWAALDSADDSSDVILIADGRAISFNVTATTAAFRADTKPTTIAQEATIICGTSAQGTNYYHEVGVLGTEAATGWATNPRGVWARLTWLANGARRLNIYRFLPSDSAAASVAQVDLVYAGSIVAAGYERRLISDGALGSLQEVRIVVDVADYGLRARVFLNSEDDDNPVLEGRIDRDYQTAGVVGEPYGTWWFGFGPSGGGTSGNLYVASAYGFDYDASEDKEVVELRSDQPRLGDVRTRVLNKYTRGGGTNRPAEMVDEAVTDTIEDMLKQFGDSAHFRITEDTVTVSPDANGRATLTAKMVRVLELRYSDSDTPVEVQTIGHSTEGAPIIRTSGAAGSYIVRYVQRHVQPKQDDDPVPIPREYLETLVLGACMRLAENDGKADMVGYWSGRYLTALKSDARDLCRTSNLERTVQRPRQLIRAYGRWR